MGVVRVITHVHASDGTEFNNTNHCMTCPCKQGTINWGEKSTFSVHCVGFFVDVPGLDQASGVPVWVGVHYFSYFPVNPMLLSPCMLSNGRGFFVTVLYRSLN